MTCSALDEAKIATAVEAVKNVAISVKSAGSIDGSAVVVVVAWWQEKQEVSNEV